MLFIVGNPRSGTSLLRLMLTNHPQICVPPECGFIQWWHGKYGDWSTSDATQNGRVQKYIGDLKTSRKIETWALDFESLAERIRKSAPGDYATLCREVIGHFAASSGRSVRYLGDKNNYYVNHLALLKVLFPKARYLCLVRDGRDVAVSYKRLKDLRSESKYKPVLPTEIDEIALQWSENNERIARQLHEDSAVDSEFIRFEDLILNGRTVLSEVCDWLGIEFNDSMLQYPERKEGRHDEPEEFLKWKKKTLNPPDPSSLGKFREELSAAEIAEFESTAGNTLLKFGYGLAGEA